MNQATIDILIVGAGLSGLIIASTLAQTNLQIAILEKNSTVGGRLATESIGPGQADTGAQFFTVRDPKFQKLVDQWLIDDIVFKWSDGWSRGNTPDGQRIIEPDGYPRFAVRHGFNALPRYLATSLARENISLQTGGFLHSLRTIDDGWQAIDQVGNVYTSRICAVTPPVPESLNLLKAGGTLLNSDDHNALSRVTYAPCLCGLFWVNGRANLPEPGAIPRPGGIIGWISDNQRKGVSPDATTITVHTIPEYSRLNYDKSDEAALAPIQKAMMDYLEPDTIIRSSRLLRWPFAQPEILHPERYLKAADLPPLYFGGDAFCHARIEGALLSGLAIGEAILKEI
ncbi:NAD(P)-binding protein [Chloroflexi bacterium TSY]|nr:NAD(P)-binding protein [Chloroflexi bacterium TSY]